jgi:cell division initiation protein
MELDARAIHTKQFHDAWRGYNQEEVDDFLDRVAEALERTQRENAQLNDRIAELESLVAQARDAEEVLKKTLMNAQRAAEEAIETAREKAEKMISEAESRARRQNEEAGRRNEQTEREHAQLKRELEASINRLRTNESDLRSKLKSFLQEQLRAVDRLDALPDRARPTAPPSGAPPRSESQRTEQPPLRATPSRSGDARLEDPAEVRSFSWKQRGSQ